MFLSFQTDISGQTVQTQIRPLKEEQSDQGLHCLPFYLHVFDKLPHGLASLFDFKVDYSKRFGIKKIRSFTVPFPAGFGGFGEISKMIGEKWRNLSADERKVRKCKR